MITLDEILEYLCSHGASEETLEDVEELRVSCKNCDKEILFSSSTTIGISAHNWYHADTLDYPCDLGYTACPK